MQRRIEDQIRDLCARAAMSASDEELMEIAIELRVALNESLRRKGNVTLATILTWPKTRPERRMG